MPPNPPEPTGRTAGAAPGTSRWLSLSLVVAQFSLMGLLVIVGAAGGPATAPGPLAFALWAAAAAVGAAALWANRPGNFNIQPVPREGGQLVTHGIYRWVRHPMYTSVLLAGIGLCVAAAPGWRLQAWGLWLLLLGVLTAKSMVEERWLAERHDGYVDYARRTRRFLPGRF
jgi:protein-S-isoprenylcysteine O-methyltransferase Ste14